MGAASCCWRPDSSLVNPGNDVLLAYTNVLLRGLDRVDVSILVVGVVYP